MFPVPIAASILSPPPALTADEKANLERLRTQLAELEKQLEEAKQEEGKGGEEAA